MFIKIVTFLFFLILTCHGTLLNPLYVSTQPVEYPVNLDTIELKEWSDNFYLSSAGVYVVSTTFDSPSWIDEIPPTLYFSPCLFSTIITINDKEVYRWGDFTNPITMTNFSPALIVLSDLEKKGNLLKIYLYSDGQASPLPRFYIDKYSAVAKECSRQELLNLYLIQAIGIIALFSSLLFLGYSAASNFEDLDILYFSFFAFSIFLGYIHFITNSPISNDLTWFTVSRIGYILAAFFLFLFTSEYTGLAKSNKLKFILLIYGIAITFYYLTSDNKAVLNDRFSIFSLGYIIPMLIFSLILCIKSRIMKNKISINLILIGLSLFLFTTSFDILHVVFRKDPYFWTTPYGYFCLISTIVLAVAFRYNKVYSSLIMYKKNLQDTNKALTETNDHLKKEANAKEEFIKAIAHEFRTPLHGMSGVIHTLLDESNMANSDHEKNAILASSFYRFELIIQNLLDYESLKNNNLDIQLHPFSPKELIDNVTEIFIDNAELKGISLISLVKKDSLPELLNGDTIRISLVLKNLLQNAIKFTNSGGVTIRSSYNNHNFIVEIADTGCGIAPASQESIFKAFEKAEELTFNQQYEGIGLGLSIVDSIVKAMHGTITIKSLENKGTKVTVSIPLIQPTSKSYHHKKISVLVVDDNNINRTVAKLQIEKFGYITDVASNGLEAIHKVEENHFDIVFMDVQMPVLNGLDATRKIKGLFPKLPIIGFTANASKDECLQSGMCDVIFKPTSSQILYDAISSHIQ